MDRPTRVVVVTNVPVPYRLPAWQDLASRPGLQLEIVYCAPPHIDPTLDAAAHGFPTHWLRGRYHAGERRFVHADPGVVALLHRLRPDVVVTTGYIPTYLMAFAWTRLAGVPHIAMTDGTFDFERVLGPLHRALRRFVLPRSAACVGASNGSLQIFSHYGVPAQRQFKAPLSIDPKPFATAAATAAPSTDLLYCGRLLAFKGAAFALDVAAATAQRLGRRVSLDFVGSGPLEADLRLRAQALQDHVQAAFHGWLPQAALPARYAAARVFLFPSEWDAWGLTANEACAAGLPVLISPHAGAAGELIVDGLNGRVLPLDVDAWATAAATLLGDPALRARLGDAGRVHVQTHSFEAAADGLADAVAWARPRPCADQRVEAV